eukprot:4081101-Karenia_brevis.AAC.1
MSAGIPNNSRHHHRLREITVQSTVEWCARDRMKRASNSNSRVAHEQPQLKPGDLVDYSLAPAKKDESGWRGPAVVTEGGPPAVVKWQGRFIQ